MPKTGLTLIRCVAPRHLTGVLALTLALLMPQQVLAHGGGLNSDGCHNETATGGYHCHNDDDEDVDWSAVGGAVGILVALWLLSDLWTDDDEQALTGFSFTPKIGPHGAGFVAEYDLDGLNRLGFSLEPDSTDRSSMYSGLRWRMAF